MRLLRGTLTRCREFCPLIAMSRTAQRGDWWLIVTGDALGVPPSRRRRSMIPDALGVSLVPIDRRFSPHTETQENGTQTRARREQGAQTGVSVDLDRPHGLALVLSVRRAT